MIDSLPRRERELFELLCSAGEATAAELRTAMKDPPSYSAVRTLLARLEARGEEEKQAEADQVGDAVPVDGERDAEPRQVERDRVELRMHEHAPMISRRACRPERSEGSRRYHEILRPRSG